MSRKLNFVFGGNAWKFQLQDKKQRVEELGEVFNKLTVTPNTPNGEIIRLSLGTFIYEIQRQYLYGLVDEFFTPTFNPLVFLYHWSKAQVVGARGWISSELIDVGGGKAKSTFIENLEVADGVFEDFNILNPFVRDRDLDLKLYRVTGDFVKLVKVTNTLYQGWNDNTTDEKTGIPNASMKMFCRQKLSQGAVIEVYPTVVPRKREDGSLWLGNRLQLVTQKLHEWMSEIDKGALDLDTAARQYYTKKALISQAYQKHEKDVATGALSESTQEMVNKASRQFAMGEEVEEFGLKVKLEGEVVDVSTVPLGIYTTVINGRERTIDTSLKVARYDLTEAAREFGSAINLVRQPDNFTF